MSAPSETNAHKHTLLLPVLAREVTRCECAGLDFAEIARLAADGSKSPETVMAEAGAGTTCTSCAQDLQAFLARSA